MAGQRVSLSWALALAIGGAPVALTPSPAVAQEAHSSVEQQARNLDEQLQQLQLPVSQSIHLSSPRDITERMVDAEVYFNLKEWANCATLLSPALEEPAMAAHPASERAHYLVAESLFQSGSLEVARASFHRILDQNQRSYEKQALTRLLEIAIAQRNLAQVDQQYSQLTARFGQSPDAEVHYLRGRAQYFRQNFEASVQDFDRVARDSDLYWRAQYHRAVSQARGGDLNAAMTSFQHVESNLAGQSLADADFDVLQLARLAQGVLHYEHGEWDAAIASYSSVERGSDAFEQALYQVAWTQIREARFDDAITNLEVLSLIAQNSRLVAEARLLSAEMRRRDGDFDAALHTFESVSDDFGLIRAQLREIRDENHSVSQRFDATESILTGSVLAAFQVDHWFPKDELARRGLEIIRESDEIGRWVAFNQDLAKEIEEALRSGFAYDRAPDLRELRGRVVDAQRRSAQWRASVLDAQRVQSGSALSSERVATEQAAAAFLRVPQDQSAYHAQVGYQRDELSDRILDLYRKEQRLLIELDNYSANEAMLRDQVRLQQTTPEAANRQRQGIRSERAQKIAELDAIREERFGMQRHRTRYGIGEAQSASMAASRQYVRAMQAEMSALGGEQNSGVAALDRLDATIERLFQELDQRVAQAWNAAFLRLDEETRIVNQLDQRQRNQRQGELRDAEALAMQGFLAMLENVDDVALRASLGEVDVAWWQKEGVSRRIESLFRERERQIRRLDADFSEIRE